MKAVLVFVDIREYLKHLIFVVCRALTLARTFWNWDFCRHTMTHARIEQVA